MIGSLFEGELVRLTPFDEKDAEIESQWTHDREYLYGLDEQLPRPLSPVHIKKNYDEAAKKANELKTTFTFAVRTRTDNKLIGYARVQWIEWNGGAARIGLGIGLPADRGRGYGTDTLNLILRYAFRELNLHRLHTTLSAENTRAVRFLERTGFVIEVRRREAIRRADKYYDGLGLAIFRLDWEKQITQKRSEEK